MNQLLVELRAGANVYWKPPCARWSEANHPLQWPWELNVIVPGLPCVILNMHEGFKRLV